MARRWIDAAAAADIGRLDADAIERVRSEAWPDATSADELCDALAWLTFMTDAEVRAQPAWPPFMARLVTEGRVLEISAAAGVHLWVPVERRALFEPEVPACPEALLAIVRGRLEGLGPVSAAALASPLGVPTAHVAAACQALELQGFAMRGHFSADSLADEWCERRLLARIHRLTVGRLRAEIEPVTARDFLRFLIDWQHAVGESRMQGPDAVAAVLSQLEGFEAPAAAWESNLLPSRILHYDPAWLDEHCRAGRFVWARLALRHGHPDKGAGPVRSTPLTLLARRNVAAWSALTTPHDPALLAYKPRAVFDLLRQHGASYFDDIADGVRLLPVEVEEALAELVSLGLVNSDSFGGLRALLVPGSQRTRHASRVRRGRRLALFGMADAGRWAVVRRDAAVAGRRPDDEEVEHVVRTLLRRWGVIFWKQLTREADWLPSWREILSCCRRLEARGEIRGGRFVAGFAGEQYAIPAAVARLREIRRRPAARLYVSVSGADPLNLAGILTPGPRLPSLAGNRLLYLDGVPIATLAAGEVCFLRSLDSNEQAAARHAVF